MNTKSPCSDRFSTTAVNISTGKEAERNNEFFPQYPSNLFTNTLTKRLQYKFLQQISNSQKTEFAALFKLRYYYTESAW